MIPTQQQNMTTLCDTFCRWASQSGVREIDMGSAMVLEPSAVTAIAAFPRLTHLTCHVRGSLPESLTGLKALQGLHITWESHMDAGGFPRFPPGAQVAHCVCGQKRGFHGCAIGWLCFSARGMAWCSVIL